MKGRENEKGFQAIPASEERIGGTITRFMSIPFIFFLLLCLFMFPTIGHAIDNKDCLDCHGSQDILKMSDDERAGMVVPPKQKQAPKQRKFSLFLNDKKFVSSAHAELYCTDCHSDIREVPHAQWLAPVNCRRCHRNATNQYTGSDHAKVSGTRCYDCHNPHESQSYRSLSVAERSNICLQCHKKVGHEWLPERELHFSSLECGACHATGAEKELVMFFSPSKRRPLTYEEIKKATGKEKGTVADMLDPNRSRNIETNEIKNFLSLLEKGGIPSPRLAGDGLVTKSYHGFTRLLPEAKDCTMCHSPRTTFYSQAFLRIPTESGWKTLPADKDAVVKLPVIPARNNYFATVHEKKGVKCIECHAYQSVIREAEHFKLREAKELVCGTRCHKEILSEYKDSVHYKVHEHFCLDCHEPHPNVPYAQLNTEQRRAICLKCHKDTEKQHKWQAQQTLHCKFVECTMCHSPKAKKGVVLYLRGIDGKGQEKRLYGTDIAELLNIRNEQLFKTLDKDSNKKLDEHEVTAFLKNVNSSKRLGEKGLEKVEMGMNLLVLRPFHNFTEKLSKAKDCSLCHSSNGEGLESLILQIPESDKKTETMPVEKEALVAFLSMPGASNFYILGGKKITKQDVMLFWEKEPLQAFINLGYKLIDIFGFLLILGAVGFVGTHGLIRVLTRPIRKRRK